MSDTSDSRIEKTAVVVLKHFQQEERLLADMLRTARRIREGLLSGDPLAQQEAFQEPPNLPAKLCELRQDLRELIAATLDLPVEQATLRRLADRAPDALREKLTRTHRRLLERVLEIDRLNRANAVLAACSIELFQRLLGDPANRCPSANRYSPSGEVLRGDNSKHAGLQIRC